METSRAWICSICFSTAAGESWNQEEPWISRIPGTRPSGRFPIPRTSGSSRRSRFIIWTGCGFAIIAWITTKTRLPGRAGLDFIAFVPIAIPGLVLGVSMILQYLSPAFRVLPIYGTLWILVVAYTTKYLPYGMRTNSAAMLQIHKELEEAGAMSGASWWLMFRRITLPLLRPALVAGWIYIFIVSVRELSASVLLVTSESTVLAVVIFDLFESGKSNAVAALSVMLILTLLVIVAAVQRLTGRFGIKE